MPHYQQWLNAVAELRKTDLQWPRFSNGYYLDYWGLPHVKSNLHPFMPVLDVANKVAAIPGDGNTPVVFTYTFDVARFVIASLDLAEWPEASVVIGDKLTWNEFMKLAEEARGMQLLFLGSLAFPHGANVSVGCKFDVCYNDLEMLKKGQVTELPHHPLAYGFFPKRGCRDILRFQSVDG